MKYIYESIFSFLQPEELEAWGIKEEEVLKRAKEVLRKEFKSLDELAEYAFKFCKEDLVILSVLPHVDIKINGDGEITIKE